jgi:protein-tyrosine phosphatase
MSSKIWSSLFPGRRLAEPEPDPAPACRVLMVCMGNICRSPTAEGVLRHKLRAAGLHELIAVDSAGTHAHHAGHPPDPRSVKFAHERGYDLSHLQARKVQPLDFERFDLVLAMDWDNLALLEEACPPEPQLRRRIRRLTEFLPSDSPLAGAQVVPDPYYGGPQGFAHVLDLIEASCDGLLTHLKNRVELVGNGAGPTDPPTTPPA